MASRGARPPGTPPGSGFTVETAATAMNHLNIGGGLKAGRIPPGMSGSSRRPKPGLTLGSMGGAPGNLPGGGAGGAGLGAGRPSLAGTPGRKPQPSGTPFSNFSAIV